MMKQVFFLLCGPVLLAACSSGQAPQRGDSPGSAPPPSQIHARGEPVNASVSSLAGEWAGYYYFGNGDTGGPSKLTITSRGGDAAGAVFWFDWSGGAFTRYPAEGEMSGVMRHGVLDFGDWKLTVSRENGALTLRLDDEIAGQKAEVWWKQR